MLTLEQQLTLNQLMPRATTTPSFVQIWFGLSEDQLYAKLSTLLAEKVRWEKNLLDWVEHNPLEAAFEFLGTASVAFYLAEKEANPKIKTYVDAFHYIATSASVGYADVFPVTQTGRAIASLVMLIGPSLTGKVLDRPTQAKRETPAANFTNVNQFEKFA